MLRERHGPSSQDLGDVQALAEALRDALLEVSVFVEPREEVSYTNADVAADTFIQR